MNSITLYQKLTIMSTLTKMATGLTLYHFVIQQSHQKNGGNNNMKRTFEEWLKIIHNMTMDDYYNLNEYQQTALHLEYTGWQ